MFFIFFIPFISQNDDYFLYIVILEKKVWPRSSFGCPLSKKNVYLMRSSLSGNSRRSIKMCKSVYAALEVMVPSSFIDIDIFFALWNTFLCFFQCSIHYVLFFLDWHTTSSLVQGFSHSMWFLGVQSLKSSLEIFQWEKKNLITLFKKRKTKLKTKF